MVWFIGVLCAYNLCVLIVYLTDKIKAVNGGWRISEACLITLAFLGGGVGGTLGMLLFRHKIRKPKFITVYVLAAVQAVAAVLICIYLF